MPIIDGVKYNLHIPKDEKEFEGLVKEHYSEIFGENSLYFDIKPELRSKHPFSNDVLLVSPNRS